MVGAAASYGRDAGGRGWEKGKRLARKGPMTGGRRGSRLSIEPMMINKTNLQNREQDLMTSHVERNLR
jgi:hypothetical protein